MRERETLHHYFFIMPYAVPLQQHSSVKEKRYTVGTWYTAVHPGARTQVTGAADISLTTKNLINIKQTHSI
jgi:quinolinate synthase